MIVSCKLIDWSFVYNCNKVDYNNPFEYCPLPYPQRSIFEPLFREIDHNYGYYKSTKRFHQINFYCEEAYLKTNMINVKFKNNYKLSLGGFSCPHTNTHICILEKLIDGSFKEIPYNKLKNNNGECYNYYPKLKQGSGASNEKTIINFETDNESQAISVVYWLSRNCNYTCSKNNNLRIYLKSLCFEDVSNITSVNN